MKEVSKINNSLKYKLGYSNFTFELWIILHKKDLKGPLTDKKQYLKYINEIFDEDFKSLDEYKEEKNFKRVVEQITLEDIINAIKRAEKIRDHNKEYNKQVTISEMDSRINIYYNITDFVCQHEISNKYLNYHESDLKEIMKSEAYRNKTDEEIQEIIELKKKDILLGVKIDE